MTMQKHKNTEPKVSRMKKSTAFLKLRLTANQTDIKDK